MTGRSAALSLASQCGPQRALEIIMGHLARHYKLGGIRVSPRNFIWLDSIKLAVFVTTSSSMVNQAFDAHNQQLGFPALMLEREQGEVVRFIELAIERKLGVDSSVAGA